ncbi:MAG: ZIP family metal transporter, partial [Bacilli bacterium]|nr:ZIP family metal transporter [Bacilli bacterium]
MNGLILTLLLGLFIIVGAIIVFFFKNNGKFIEFSIAMALSVILMLLIFDIIPEAYEVVDTGNTMMNIFILLFGSAIGFLVLRILDHFIPDHEDDSTTEEDNNRNLNHIGFVSSIALVIHNIVEGIAIYTLYNTDSQAGIMAGIGVGLHNIPLGMVIASTFYQYNKKKGKTSLIILGISLSTFLGGLIMNVFHIHEVVHMVEVISLTMTLGMLIYISVMELIPKVRHTMDKKAAVSGLFVGFLLILIATLI